MKNRLKKIFITKNRSYLSLVLGSLSALAMPPYCITLILFITYPSMLYLFETANSKRRAFWYGWLFGLGYFAFGLYWISNAVINELPYLLMLSILGIPMFLALYMGILGFITNILSKRIKGIFLILSFSVLFVLLEIARGTILTGFPWNLTAYTWTNFLSIMQGFYYFGIYGFSFISIFLFSLPYLFFCKNKKMAIITNILGLLFLITLFIVGNSRVEENTKSSIFNKDVLFIQPSLPLEIKDLQFAEIFTIYYNQTAKNVNSDVDIIVWGETAIPFAINNYPNYLSYLAKIIPDGAILLTGSIRRDEEGNNYNSILVINDEGKIIAHYDKSHLVPFGEYMPLGKYLNINKLVGFSFEFSEGKGRKTIEIDGFPSFSPLVCYEIIFSNKLIDKNNRPDFIFSVSNDSFYGISSGPYQYFSIVKAQAVATNLPIIRIGNNGISGIINKVGKVKDYIGLGEKESKIMHF